MSWPPVRLHGRTIAMLHDALARRPGQAASWLTDLFDRERPVIVRSTDRPDVVRDLVTLNLVRTVEDRVEPLARIDRIGNLLVASDLLGRRRAADFVVCPGHSSFLLARHVRPPARGPILDLGCGSGIQGLLLGSGRTDVLGLDINPRALAFATFNAEINGRRRMHAKLGDFLGDEPDRGLDGRFSTVVANPPFVLGPRLEFVYRDRPLPGDEVSARTIERVGRALAPGGRGYVLCNWIDRGAAWSDPVRVWLSGTALDSVVTRVATVAPAEYAAIWTRDIAPAEREAATAAWAATLDGEGIRLIHVGVVALSRRNGRRPPGSRFTAMELRPAQ
jgi:SAM-dependent methyltransferase